MEAPTLEVSEIAEQDEPIIKIERSGPVKTFFHGFKRFDQRPTTQEAQDGQAETELITESLNLPTEEKQEVENMKITAKSLKVVLNILNHLNPVKTPQIRLVYAAFGVSLIGSLIDCKVPHQTLEYLEGFSKLSPEHLQVLAGVMGGGSGGLGINEKFAKDKSLKSKVLWGVLGAAAGILPVEVNSFFHGPDLANAAISLVDDAAIIGTQLAIASKGGKKESPSQSNLAPAYARISSQRQDK